MLQHAAELGANAVVGARYDATEIMQGVTEVLAYGTAVSSGGNEVRRNRKCGRSGMRARSIPAGVDFVCGDQHQSWTCPFPAKQDRRNCRIRIENDCVGGEERMPTLTEASAVKQRITGIINEFTTDHLEAVI